MMLMQQPGHTSCDANAAARQFSSENGSCAERRGDGRQLYIYIYDMCLYVLLAQLPPEKINHIIAWLIAV